nr:hypothetical protein [uncultured Draconibacterium sp.]
MLFVLLLFACEKDVMNTSLEDFCNVKPDGWNCELIESNFNPGDIPQNADTPLAVIKYYNSNREFNGIGQTNVNPSLILNFYPIERKDDLLSFIESQQVYSWCIPIYFGETKDYFVITSPCFKNSGTFTEEANSSIADLYAALDKIIIKRDYN